MIFVDTSFWIALRNDRDRHHEEASRLYTIHVDEPKVTTNNVRGEAWTYLRRKAGFRSAVGFLDALSASRITVAFIADDLDALALSWLRRRDEREYSFVDATSFVYMRANRIRRALAFDGDFAAAGFEELRAS